MDLQKIEEVIRPLVEQNGLRLYDVEFQGRTLKVFIHKDGGASINDCAETSRLLNPVLDVEDLVPGGRWELEVSTPGLDRDLKKPHHFESALGEMIHVITTQPLSNWNKGTDENDKFFEKRKKIKGKLIKFDQSNLEIETDGRMVIVPIHNLSRAYVNFELIKGPKKGKKV